MSKTAAAISPAVAAKILMIAQAQLGLETLETRNSDELDFSDVAVWSIEAALAAAYEAGRIAGKAEANSRFTK